MPLMNFDISLAIFEIRLHESAPDKILYHRDTAYGGNARRIKRIRNIFGIMAGIHVFDENALDNLKIRHYLKELTAVSCS